MTADHSRPGPKLRTDIVDVYVFRQTSTGIEFLQLRRSRAPLDGTWQPIMGHIEPGETATETAQREMAEEVGLATSHADLIRFFALEQVYPFFLPEKDQIVLSPRFAAEVSPSWQPTLNHEHDGHRWIRQAEVAANFMWPGQRAAIAELIETVSR
ncbi:MAG: NUDIX domain-containing protein [Planctomycetota bacterium]